MAGRRRGGKPARLRRPSLRERFVERALLRELRRLRQLLEMDDTAYSDLAVLARAREELQSMADDEYEELEERDQLEDDDS